MKNHNFIFLVILLAVTIMFIPLNSCSDSSDSDDDDDIVGDDDDDSGKSWGTAELIETDNSGPAVEPRIAFDPYGNGIAVWVQYDGTRNNILSKRFIAGKGWEVSELIENDDQDAGSPQIAFNTLGDAIVVWKQTDGTRYNIFAKRYIAGTGWQAAELIEEEDEEADSPQIAFDSAGNAVALWVQVSGGTSGTGDWDSILSNRYVSGVGWQTPERLEEVDWSAYLPQIAVNPSGNAVAVWIQDDGPAESNIWANRYISGEGWQGTESLETEAGYTQSPQIAIDNSGNAIAVWTQHDGTRTNICSNMFLQGTGWQGAELLETDDGWADSPKIAFDASGNAITVWRQQDSITYRIYANRYIQGTGWQSPQLIENNDSGPTEQPEIAFDNSGNAFAMWPRNVSGGGYCAGSNIFISDSGWQTAENINTGSSTYIEIVQIDIDSHGNAIAVWAQIDSGTSNIWANTYR